MVSFAVFRLPGVHTIPPVRPVRRHGPSLIRERPDELRPVQAPVLGYPARRAGSDRNVVARAVIADLTAAVDALFLAFGVGQDRAGRLTLAQRRCFGR